MNLILASIGVFLGIILLLVVILLVAKQYLTPSGKVKITINGEKELEVEQGSTLLNTLSVNGIYLSSACGVFVVCDKLVTVATEKLFKKLLLNVASCACGKLLTAAQVSVGHNAKGEIVFCRHYLVGVV